MEYTYKPGTIKSIKLVNFMCHESFELTLGPRVNFIIGHNGSGKSALLTAIVVALGGRATVTSRAKRTNEFVMYGKSQGKIVIVLHNYEKVMDKERAFKPDDYGKFIIIEKILLKDGVSKLVLKNDKERKVSERRHELDEMLDHFGILINNPICILNQEISKTFLHSKRPEDKFELFMKATNLEQIANDYGFAKKLHEEWADCNERKTVAFKMLDSEYAGCKEKTHFLENRAKLNDHRETLTRELLWAFIRDNEAASSELTTKVRDIDQELAEQESQIEGKRSKLRKLDEELSIVRAKITSISERREEAYKKLQHVRSKDLDVKTKHMNIKQKLDHSKRKVARYTEDQAGLQKTIDDLKRQFRDQNALDQDNERRKMDLERLDRELAHDRAREKSLRLHTEQLGSSMTSVRSELHTSSMKVNDLKSKLSEKQALLRRLKNGQDNEIRKYGDYVVRLRDEINRAHEAGRFRIKPVGPLGYYLKLKSPLVAQALELCLGKNAHAFACDNHQDMTTLNAICKRMSSSSHDFRQPLIITRSFGRPHDVNRFKAHHTVYKTLLDYIDVENEAVHNALVDRASLECILFIPEYSKAEALMIDEASVPTHTRCAYTADCAVMYPKTHSTGYKSFSNNPSRYMLFSSGNGTQIVDVERDISLLNANIRDAESIVKNLQESLNTQRNEYDQNNKEVRKLIDDIRRKEEEQLNLKTTMTTEPQELSALEAEYDNTSRLIEVEKLSIQENEQTLDSINEQMADVKTEREECQAILRRHEEERTANSKVIESTKSTMSEYQDYIKSKQILMSSRSKEREELDKKLQEAIDKLARSKQNAPTDSEAPATIRSTSALKEELRKIEAQLRIDAEEQRDPEELIASLRKRMAEIEELNGLKKSNLGNFSLTSKSLNDRKEGFASLRANTVSAVSTTFTTVMRSMRMNGELRIYLDNLIERGEVIRKANTLEMRIDTNYAPSQRVGSVMSDNNNNTSLADHERGAEGDSVRQVRRRRPVSASQPAEFTPSRAKRARTDNPAGVGGAGRQEKENEKKLADSRSLSGGERSFSTVAFVLALWHHCSSPFKLMDEIDVFMDMVTRRVSYNALIRFAQVSEDPGQFVFFSPLELPKFDNSDDFVRVFEMPAIVRKGPQSQAAAGAALVEEEEA